MKRDGIEMRLGEVCAVREYAEGFAVHLVTLPAMEAPFMLPDPREVIEAVNEGGHNATLIDLLDLVAWIKEHRPELFVPTTPTKGTTKP